MQAAAEGAQARLFLVVFHVPSETRMLTQRDKKSLGLMSAGLARRLAATAWESDYCSGLWRPRFIFRKDIGCVHEAADSLGLRFVLTETRSHSSIRKGPTAAARGVNSVRYLWCGIVLVGCGGMKASAARCGNGVSERQMGRINAKGRVRRSAATGQAMPARRLRRRHPFHG